MMGNETNVSCNSTPFTHEQKIHFQNYSWWVETMGNLCCGCIGIFLNSVTINVFSSPALRKNFFNRLLICLAIFDTLYITCEISEVFRHRYNTFLQQSIFVNFVYPIRNIFMFSSVYMTVVLAFERYQAITDPVQYRIRGLRTSMARQLLLHLLPGVAFAVIYYLPKFFELDVGVRNACNNYVNETLMNINDTAEEAINMGTKRNCIAKYILVPTNLRRNHLYVFWYIIVLNLTLTAVLPLSVLTFLNCKIISSLKKFSENKKLMRTRNPTTNTESSSHNNNQSTSNSNTDLKKTFILFSIVVLFALCHSLRVAFNIDEFIYRMRQNTTGYRSCRSTRIWTKYVGPFNALSIILNSSLNFFIYALFDTGFQQVLRKRLKMNYNTPLCQNADAERTGESHGAKRIKNNDIELSSMNTKEI